MGIVYRKTEKGQTEIATRAHRLVPRLRSTLILVDGKRSDEELAKLIPAPADGVLASLQADGFIEALAAPATPAPVNPTASPPSVAAVVLTLDETRRRAVRWLSDHLGPYADPLNLRLEKVKTTEELRAALLLAVSFVRQQLGAARTQEFEQHVGLPPSAR
jgi:DNA-binding transcriptional ArsR family regulator